MMWKGHWQGIGYRNESGARSGLQLRHWRWGQACSDRRAHYEAEGLGRVAPSKGEHTWSAWPKPQSGSRLCEIATKDLISIPTENMNGLSLDQAIVCPYLTAVDTWIWITNTTFPSSRRELFAVGDMLRLWEGHRVWEQIPLLWDATRELCRMKDNQPQECLVFTNCWRKTHGEHSCTSRGRQLTPVLEDSTVRETQLGKLEPALNCSWGRWTGGLTGTEGGGPRPSAPARPKARGNLMCN